jgi:hypothetical protein
MKRFLSAIVLCICGLGYSFSQQQNDPFNWTEPIVIPSSIYVLWSGGPQSDSITPRLNVYFGNTVGHSIDSLRSESLNTPVGGSRKMYLENTDLDHNGTDDLIGAWEGADSSVAFYLLDVNNWQHIPVEGKLLGGYR